MTTRKQRNADIVIEIPDDQRPPLTPRQKREALRAMAHVHYLIGDIEDVMACRCGHGNTWHRRNVGRCMTAVGPHAQCPCRQLWPGRDAYWLLEG